MRELAEQPDDGDLPIEDTPNFDLALPKDVLADIIFNFLGQRKRLT